MIQTTQTADCQTVEKFASPYVDRLLPNKESLRIDAHLESCSSCRHIVEQVRSVQGLLEYAQNISETGQENAVAASLESQQTSWTHYMGAAPWWGVSVLLHGLIMALAALVSMAIDEPSDYDAVVMITDLSDRPAIAQVEVEKPKSPSENVLQSAHETPPTDPTSKEASDIVVPSDILAKAERGDHFETINLDRPDTQSAFGNPDAHIFYSEKGNDDAEGGGGMGGTSGLDELIGIGGAAGKGMGGGWGGGNGTGIGVGTGAGQGGFGQRSGGGRKFMLKKHGGSQATENAVDLALQWLAYHQEPEGNWSAKKTEGDSDYANPGITGLALLAFLGAGHTEKIGKYKENVRRAVRWIISEQREDGAIGTKHQWTEHHGGFGYQHAIGGLALVEAAGMARVPETVIAAQKAVTYSCEVYQYGENSEKLAWRYVPKAKDSDVSVSGWYIMQLKSAKLAGLIVNPNSFAGAMEFLDSVECNADTIKKEDDAYDNGRHRYGYTDRTVTHNTTAIGVLCRLFLGVKPDEVQGAASWLLRTSPPAWKADLGKGNGASGWPMYYMYYTTLAMFQVGGDTWKSWNEGLKKVLTENQRRDGDAAGSWDGFEGWEKRCGRTYTTALGALSLEVYYRYMQLKH